MQRMVLSRLPVDLRRLDKNFSFTLNISPALADLVCEVDDRINQVALADRACWNGTDV